MPDDWSKPSATLRDERRVVYLRGWFAAFASPRGVWPHPGPGELIVPPHLASDWDRGVHDALMARHTWRHGEGARR